MAAAADEDALAGRPRHGAHDGSRRGYPEACRIVDDKQRRSGDEVAGHRQDSCAGQAVGNQPVRPALRVVLRTGVEHGRVAHHLDHAAHLRVGADAGRAHPELAFDNHRRGVDFFAGDLFDRHGLAGERMLIDEGFAADYDAIDRDALAGEDVDRVALRHTLHRDRDDLTVMHHPGLVDHVVEDLVQLLAGPFLRAAADEVAGGDHHVQQRDLPEHALGEEDGEGAGVEDVYG